MCREPAPAAEGEMAKSTLRPLSELCADFKRKCGSDSKETEAVDDALWEVPSDVPSDNERNEAEVFVVLDQTYNPRATTATKASKRTALNSLDKLQEKFQVRQKEREKTEQAKRKSSSTASGSSTEASESMVKGNIQPGPPTAAHTGTL